MGSAKNNTDSRDGENTGKFILVRKKREYCTNEQYPKIRIDQETYNNLANLAVESCLSMSEVTRRAVRYAIERLEWAEE